MSYIGSPAAPTIATVSDDTITTAKLADDAVTDTKISTLSGDLNFGDNAKANFGASNDLQIYHDGNNSYISDEGTGTLRVRSSNQLVLQVGDDAGGWENAILANNNAGVALRYNNATKLSTTGTGVDVTGDLRFNSGYGSVATAYGCRVWINFNGTGTVTIVNSGNVSSVTDNGTGHYTVNFSNSFPDNAYAVCTGEEGGFDVQRYQSYAARNSGSYVLKTGYQTTSGSLAQADIGTIMLAIFR